MIVFDEFNEISVLYLLCYCLKKKFPICPLKLFKSVFYIIFNQTFRIIITFIFYIVNNLKKHKELIFLMPVKIKLIIMT